MAHLYMYVYVYIYIYIYVERERLIQRAGAFRGGRKVAAVREGDVII